MNDLIDVYIRFNDIDNGDLSGNQKKGLYKTLSSVESQDLLTIDEHKLYLELLRKFRMASLEDAELLGKNFRKTIESLLAVGADGVYSNSLRFIYELIQNVDDCEFVDPCNCSLDVMFDFTNEGLIILSYNEKGFTPENVFAITGIAEKSKNIYANKIEIGEKGIGFKSVFGIADSVLIQSGNFSFELHKDNFTIPIPQYDKFEFVNGTKLTLRMDARKAYDIYQEIIKLYGHKSVLLNKNPILFLNKLTNIRFFIDNNNRYIRFYVSRTNSQQIEKVQFEDGIKVAVDIENIKDGQRISIHNEILCYRYSMPIVYNEEACKSRYSEDILFSERPHKLVAVIPYVNEISEKEREGALYSFLPTQMKTTVPMVIHIPYKLDASREYVDSQGNNKWFSYTNEMLSGFLKDIYNNLAITTKEDIVEYLPKSNAYFFDADNEKINCLKIESLSEAILKNEKLFFTVNSTFESAKNVVAFDSSVDIKDAKNVYRMLGIKENLFVPKKKNNMVQLGVETIKDANVKLFDKALKNPSLTKDALVYLTNVEKFDFEKRISELKTLTLNLDQIRIISGYKEIFEEFQKSSVEKIKKGDEVLIIYSGQVEQLDANNKSIIDEVFEDLVLDKRLLKYLDSIGRKYSIAPDVEDEFYFACKDILILSKNAPLSSFALLTEKFDKKGTFSATLKMRQASEDLNNVACKNMSNSEYLKFLYRVRKSLVNAFGKEVYNNYIQIINKAGINENRFVNELLQNADDCRYSTSEEPRFTFQYKGNELTTYYNEVGFLKENVRSITAIGESTKKLLLTGYGQQIGEKGIGFKSVFGVAKSVSIFSNGFNFKLTANRPTIPEPVEISNASEGTKMVFDLEKLLPDNLFSQESTMYLCVCLRKLKALKLGIFNVFINDDNDGRVITVNSKEYRFKKFVYPFVIDDLEAIAEREEQKRKIDKNQEICIYYPENKLDKFLLYTGLPTEIEVNIPILVDAPFEATTSREDIIHNKWNDIIRDEFYKALVMFIDLIKKQDRINVFRYIKADNVFFSSQYLNDSRFGKKIANEKIIPIWNNDKFVSPIEHVCKIYPDVCLYLFNKGVNVPSEGYIVDCFKKHNFDNLLIILGCKTPALDEIMAIIGAGIELYMHDNMFRELLYSFLINDKNYRITMKSTLNSLKIIPVKSIQGNSDFIQKSENVIFLSAELNSTDEFYILDEEILSASDFYEIFGEPLQKMDDAQRQYLYKQKVLQMIKNPEKHLAAEWLLNEFHTNRKMLDTCKYELKGRVFDIPFKVMNGEFVTGYKYIDLKRTGFFGDVLRNMVVDTKYENLAKYFDCENIYNIHYDNIDCEVDEISADDIEDFWNNGFLYRNEIFKGFINDSKISEELIKKYGLAIYSIPESMYNEENEFGQDFPTCKITDPERLRLKILEYWEKPNKFIYKTKEISERVSSFAYDKDTYAKAMYSGKYSSDSYFCQICKKNTSNRYVEVNAIEFEPEYAWNQMQLCLCIKCSKDFESSRYNKDLRRAFLLSLASVDINQQEPIEVGIGDVKISFTATHLAEIQEILKLQNIKHE